MKDAGFLKIQSSTTQGLKKQNRQGCHTQVYQRMVPDLNEIRCNPVQ